MQLVSGKFGHPLPVQILRLKTYRLNYRWQAVAACEDNGRHFWGAVLISESKPRRYGLFQGSEGLGWAADPSHQQSPWVPERNLNFGKQNEVFPPRLTVPGWGGGSGLGFFPNHLISCSPSPKPPAHPSSEANYSQRLDPIIS